MPEEKATTTPMTRERDPLAFEMRERGYFTEEQIQNFEAINPKDGYKVVVILDGQVVKEKDGTVMTMTVTGQTMRNAIGSYKTMIAVGDNRKSREQRQEARQMLHDYIESTIEIPKDIVGKERQEMHDVYYKARMSAPIELIKGHELYKKIYSGDPVIRSATKPDEKEQSSVHPEDDGKNQSAIIRETETMLATVEKNMDALLPVPETGTPTVDAMANAAAQEGRTAVANALNQSGEWKVAQQSGTTLEMLLAQNMADPGLPKEVQKPAGQKTAALVP